MYVECLAQRFLTLSVLVGSEEQKSFGWEVLLRTGLRRACMQFRGGRFYAAPVAIGRVESAHHSLHEPGYKAAPSKPAVSNANRL